MKTGSNRGLHTRLFATATTRLFATATTRLFATATLLLLGAGAGAQPAAPAMAAPAATAPAMGAPAATAPAMAAPAITPPAGPSSTTQKETFVRLDSGTVHSPFTTATVLKLNAIVRRAKADTDSYDSMIASVRADVDAGAAPAAGAAARAKGRSALARIRSLCADAAAARADMAAAKTALEASKEDYNGAILAGMVGFTIDVDTELTATATELSARLGAQ